LAAIVSIVVALLGQARLSSRPDRARKRVEGSLVLLKDVQAQGGLAEAATRLKDLIDEQVDYLARVERKVMERRYDPSQPFLALLFGAPVAYGAYLLWDLGEWYWKLTASLVALFVVVLGYVGVAGFFSAPRTRAEDHPSSAGETVE
jgi:hypothetical protein